jgi:hypothetical protein
MKNSRSVVAKGRTGLPQQRAVFRDSKGCGHLGIGNYRADNFASSRPFQFEPIRQNAQNRLLRTGFRKICRQRTRPGIKRKSITVLNLITPQARDARINVDHRHVPRQSGHQSSDTGMHCQLARCAVALHPKRHGTRHPWVIGDHRRRIQLPTERGAEFRSEAAALWQSRANPGLVQIAQRLPISVRTPAARKRPTAVRDLQTFG